MSFCIDLSGNRALVTGGGQSVGRAISLTLASAGASVIVNDSVAERAEAVAEEVRAAGGDAVAAPFDVTDFDAVIDGVGKAGGTIDILVNNTGNAGVAGFNFAPFHESRPEDRERYFGVNLHGVMHCTRAVLPGMIDKNYGRVVTIVSDAGRWGEPRMAAYSAAKAGAAGFTRSLARNMTPGQAEARNKQLRSYIIRRMGRPDDVAAMATFLVSPMTSWITGQTYPVNVGYTVNQ